MDAPKYLTGDPAGIQEFLDKFDVSKMRPIMLVARPSASEICCENL